METRKRLDVFAIGRALADRREHLGLDQETLADRAGVSRPYISRLERGNVPNPKLLDLERVAGALDIPVAALVQPPVDPSHEIHIAECTDILAQLDGEPPEVIADVLLMLRTSVAIAKHRRTGRNN